MTRKLKGYVMPTVYLLAIATIIMSILIIGKSLRNVEENKETDEDSTYVINSIITEETTQPVNDEQEITKTIKPFTGETILVKKEFYEKDAKEEVQQNSLILYEGTYMQNTGILYTSESSFDVIATMDGTIKNVKEDEILGIVVEIEHNSKLTTVYQSLKETNVTVGQSIKQGEVIGISGTNKINPESTNSLLFEVYHNGKLINPNNFYEKDIKEFTE